MVTIHDLKYLRYPHYFGRLPKLKTGYMNMLFRHTARTAASIIAVSAATRRDFLERYGTIVARRQVAVKVVHEAPAMPASAKDAAAPPTLQPAHTLSSYFLYVGELRPHKNIAALIAAFMRMRHLHSADVRLLIAGRRHAGFSPPAAESGVEFLGGVPNEALPTLYRNALALCLVSRYEGFGLPIVEAMQHGTPVLTSTISAMPEVAGDAALLVDPDDTEAIGEALWRLYSDADLRLELRRKGAGARATVQLAACRAGDAAGLS